MKNERSPLSDEWNIIETMLPEGWKEKAKELNAFQRIRYTDSPSRLLRLILYHAISDGGLRTTTVRAKAAGIATMSPVALHKRLKTSGPWLRWIAEELCQEFRCRPSFPDGFRPRAVDSTTIQYPASKTSDWRIHYSLDLTTLGCDWHEVTTVKKGEGLERTPCRQGDVLIADRGYHRVRGILAVVASGGHVLLRMKWNHHRLNNERGKKVSALSLVKNLKVGQVGDWPVYMTDEDDNVLSARIVAVKLPIPIAKKARDKLRRNAQKKQQKIDPRSLKAAGYVMLFTTLPTEQLHPVDVTELYRFRWQIEIAFKRHKQLLQLGKLPHKNPKAAETWIIAKLVVALLLEKLYRHAADFFPWGFSLSKP